METIIFLVLYRVMWAFLLIGQRRLKFIWRQENNNCYSFLIASCLSGFFIVLFLFDVNLDSSCQLLRFVLTTTQMVFLTFCQDCRSQNYVCDDGDNAQNIWNNKFTKSTKIRLSQGIFQSFIIALFQFPDINVETFIVRGWLVNHP